MSVSIAALPAKTLQKLKEGPTIVIQYKPAPTSEPQILDSNFPKGVAKAFSTKWSALLPQVNRVLAADVNKAHPTVFTITGGSKASHLFVLNWMRACCAGNGVRPIPQFAPEDKPFSQYFFLKESATLIGCTYLETKLGNRMQAISAKQVHSEDVRVLYKDLPADHDMIKFLAEHVAMLLWNRDLKARPAYETLRKEIPAFNDDINAILNPLIAQRRENNKFERDERIQKIREERRAQNQKEAKARSKAARKGVKFVEKKPEEEQTVDTQAKKPVPGADETSTTPCFKNKAAKRRQKKREKATEVEQ